MEEDANSLAKRCDEAFDLFRHDCSHAVWHVIRLYKPDQPYMQANNLVSYLSKGVDWREVPLSDLSRLANQGVLIVGGLQEHGHGHVIVVYPGYEKPKGGFYFTNKETGERQFSAPAGMYARTMSTSLSQNPFPGAISRGDKTVRDPWPSIKFKQVKFWQYTGKKRAASQSQKEGADRSPSEKIWI